MKAIHVIALALVLSLALVGVALANGSPEWPRQVLGGGASHATAGRVSMRATLGQPLVGHVSGRGITLDQGYWHGAPYSIYLPLIMRTYQP